jgi:hypothetical protein
MEFERLAASVFLDHDQLAQLDAFEGREPTATSRTVPAAADRRIVLTRTAILHLTVFMSTERATHEVKFSGYS